MALFFLNNQNTNFFNLQTWKTRHLEFCQQGGTQYAKNVLDENVASFLGEPMTWKQEKYNLIAEYPANRFENTRSLVKDLIYRLPNKESLLPIKNQTWMNYTRYMKDYLSGYKKRKTFFKGWYLVGIEKSLKRSNNLQRLTENKPTKPSKQPIEVQNMLIKGGYLWVHDNSNISDVLLTPGKFENFHSFIKKLLNLLPEKDQPLHYQNFDNLTSIRTKITREFTKVIIASAKRKSYCGWKFKLV